MHLDNRIVTILEAKGRVVYISPQLPRMPPQQGCVSQTGPAFSLGRSPSPCSWGCSQGPCSWTAAMHSI